MTKQLSISCILYIARHGETEWNNKRLLQGATDIDLNEKGELEAKDLAKKLKKVHFDAFYSSDLSRAYRTAEVVAQDREMAVTARKALRERSFGDLEGKKYEYYNKKLERQMKFL